jgi:hypothetical protein
VWWPFIPWLLFLLALGATFVGYQHRHRQQQHRTEAAPSTAEGPGNVSRKRRQS